MVDAAPLPSAKRSGSLAVFGLVSLALAIATSIAARLPAVAANAVATAARGSLGVASGALFTASAVLLASAWIAPRRDRRPCAPVVRIEALVAGTLAALGVLARWDNWPGPGAGGFELPLGVAVLATAFPLLVLERRLSLQPATDIPPPAAIARLLRVSLIELVVAGGSLLARRAGLPWTFWFARAAGGLGDAVALELIVRSLVLGALPLEGVHGPPTVADSFVARIAVARRGPVNGFTDALRAQFGVDLSRMWAATFLRRAAIPLTFVFLSLAWSLTGLTALAATERGVYERLGVPTAVFGPGLHVHLPWPLGSVRRVELEVVHETSIVLEVGASAEVPVGVEDPPPPSADRFWNQVHAGEGTYLIPGAVEVSSQKSVATFELVSADVRVLWRIGLSDESAQRALYRLADGDALVRSIAGRLLVRDFAVRSLDKVIGQDRDLLGAAVRADLQRELDRFGSGLEITGLLVDAIHPPSGAANAYHQVQAAGIRAATTVSVERTRRARTDAEAQSDAVARVRSAEAGAAEAIAVARVARSRFDADRESVTSAGSVLALERWFETLATALARSKLDLVDHRLDLSPGPTIDLRPPSATMRGFEDE